MEGTGKEYPEKMEKDHHQKDVAAPVMDIAYKLSERDVMLEREDRLIGLLREWQVNKFEQHSRPKRDKDQDGGHPPETPGQGKSERTFRDGTRSEMKNNAIEKAKITLSTFHRPGCARKNRVFYSLKKVWVFFKHFVK